MVSKAVVAVGSIQGSSLGFCPPKPASPLRRAHEPETGTNALPRYAASRPKARAPATVAWPLRRHRHRVVRHHRHVLACRTIDAIGHLGREQGGVASPRRLFLLCVTPTYRGNVPRSSAKRGPRGLPARSARAGGKSPPRRGVGFVACVRACAEMVDEQARTHTTVRPGPGTAACYRGACAARAIRARALRAPVSNPPSAWL